MTPHVPEYPDEVLARQPIGYWTGEAYRTIVGQIRADLAVEGLTQPHWWILNHVAGDSGTWDRDGLVRRLARFDDLDTDFDAVLDDLLGRGWLARSPAGAFVLTARGEAGRQRAAERGARTNARIHEGISAQGYAAALTVLRRMIANLDGEADLPG
ncbi:MarR family transcriptional regulator [Frankia sp. AgB32]|uniref:MarR family transcriptional regulator n=1 Tax=Frankia sp. AgB32 TaxID=631119 RepID=UPI00200D090A|nr:MarR family transcriptional regulator [Frankia sp. AgB32]MCK9894449.1 MarR family transcriptional regulator [Frankia sp. AgB32]